VRLLLIDKSSADSCPALRLAIGSNQRIAQPLATVRSPVVPRLVPPTKGDKPLASVIIVKAFQAILGALERQRTLVSRGTKN